MTSLTQKLTKSQQERIAIYAQDVFSLTTEQDRIEDELWLKYNWSDVLTYRNADPMYIESFPKGMDDALHLGDIKKLVKIGAMKKLETGKKYLWIVYHMTAAGFELMAELGGFEFEAEEIVDDREWDWAWLPRLEADIVVQSSVYRPDGIAYDKPVIMLADGKAFAGYSIADRVMFYSVHMTETRDGQTKAFLSEKPFPFNGEIPAKP